MKIIKTLALSLLLAQTLYASPVLQLDISGGSYDGVGENIVNNSNQFNLIALLNNATLANGDYFISMALTPIINAEDPSLGSIIFGSKTIDLTKDLQFGTPPVELYTGNPDRDLATHNIYPSLFTEFAFTFSPTQRTTEYNSADYPGSLSISSAGSMLYQTFAVDVSNLNPNYSVHFDLYDKTLVTQGNKSSGDLDASPFAPFSHDAQASVQVPVNVPEPSIAPLLLFGLAGLPLLRRKK